MIFPREANSDHFSPQALLWILGALTMALIPHVPTMPVSISLLCFLVGSFWLWFLRQTGKPYTAQFWLRTTLTLVSLLALVASYGHILGRESGTALLLALAYLKLLELRQLRDILLVILLGFFSLMTLAFQSQTVAMTLYVFANTFFLTFPLIILHQPKIKWPTGIRHTSILLMQAIPVMVIIFTLFPRLPTPLWALPDDMILGVTGLSDTMRPGSITELVRSEAVVFRVQFHHTPPTIGDMYWRGPVLWQLSGDTWQTLQMPENHPPDNQWLDTPHRYTVTMEPNQQPFLFALDLPAEVPSDSKILRDYRVLSSQPTDTTKQYQIVSHFQYQTKEPLPLLERQAALQLPTTGNPQTRKMAREWSATAPTDADIVKQALLFFKTQPFTYTLSPPRLGTNAIDTFLLHNRHGFCEHFASSFTFLMRAAGVPARVVTGYQGGEFNPLAEHLTVRQADAHAWSEVWLAGKGWVRVDPTAIVAPERVERGFAQAIPRGARVSITMDPNHPLLKKVWRAWDAIDHHWNQWIVGFDAQRQMRFLADLGWNQPTYWAMALGVVAGVAIFLGLWALWPLFRPSGVKKEAQLVKHYRIFCQRLAKYGVIRKPNEGPIDFATRAGLTLPEMAKSIHTLSQRYAELHYGPKPSAASIQDFVRLVRVFKVRPSRQAPP